MKNLPSIFNPNFLSFAHELDNLFPTSHSHHLSHWQEAEGKASVSFDLPGLKKEDIKISLEEDVLTIKGAREIKGAHGTQKKTYVYRSYLPENVLAENIEASYENGVLTLGAPVTKQEPKVKMIEVK